MADRDVLSTQSEILYPEDSIFQGIIEASCQQRPGIQAAQTSRLEHRCISRALTQGLLSTYTLRDVR